MKLLRDIYHVFTHPVAAIPFGSGAQRHPDGAQKMHQRAPGLRKGRGSRHQKGITCGILRNRCAVQVFYDVSLPIKALPTREDDMLKVTRTWHATGLRTDEFFWGPRVERFLQFWTVEREFAMD